tara:strand:+ start:400 stop:663 length:264 start_codon:yes stop_codon:yes gene_type:complete
MIDVVVRYRTDPVAPGNLVSGFLPSPPYGGNPMSDNTRTINPDTEEVLETYALMSRQEAEGIIEQTHCKKLLSEKPCSINSAQDCTN